MAHLYAAAFTVSFQGQQTEWRLSAEAASILGLSMTMHDGVQFRNTAGIRGPGEDSSARDIQKNHSQSLAASIASISGRQQEDRQASAQADGAPYADEPDAASDMRFHVLGIGAVGSLFSNHLRRALDQSHSVSLILKSSRYVTQFQRNSRAVVCERDGALFPATGFHVENFDASARTSPSSSPPQTDDRIDSLFVITKAHTTIPAILKLLPRLSRDSTIVLLQNGMGIYEQLLEDVFRNPFQRPHFILASNTHGSFLKGIFHVVHAGVGELKFSIVPSDPHKNYEAGFTDMDVPPDDRRARLSDITTPDDPDFLRYRSLRNTVAALLLLDSLQTSWVPVADMQIIMRRKLAINAIVNPLTAIMNCRNGEVFTSDYAKTILRMACGEIAKVFAAEFLAGAKDYVDSAAEAGIDPNDVVLSRLPRELSSPDLQAEVLRVAELTKGNYSSMLSDVRRGRSTEIDFINGYLIKQGVKYNQAMPVNKMLYNLVQMRSSIPLDNIVS
jgi:2-dehydropantoate 2-reductase